MRLVFLGTPDFAVPSLVGLHGADHTILLVVCQPDRPAGRGRRIQACPIKRQALSLGIPVAQPQRIDEAVIAGIADLAVDLAVVVAYGLILPGEFLTIPRHGCINLHASLLPRWRGASPIVHAILQGDTTTGVTTMKMDRGIDTGPILLQRECPLGENETAGEVEDRLSHMGADLLLETIVQQEEGTLRARPQDTSQASYAPKIRPEVARIAWNAGALAVSRQVRAFNPRPGARTTYGGTGVKIWRAGACAPPSEMQPPGTILSTPGALSVACGGASCIEVTEVQMEGRRPVSGTDAMRGRWFEAGRRFEERQHGPPSPLDS